ncbi:bifunctional anthranilate synthase component I family protein/class IV aminotransferase [Curvibacter sp. CHRR-16]|nr:bifunctional anthranilate synthase component I family protein/class IV aminotransferase [Curvibacter sp. CHRR-16]
MVQARNPDQRECWAFAQPMAVLQTSDAAQVQALLDAVHQQALQGRWCVGYVRYEAAPGLDAALAVKPVAASAPQAGPLVWFAVFDQPLEAAEAAVCLPQAKEEAALMHIAWRSATERTACTRGVEHIHQAIRAGELYQVNYTTQLYGSALAQPSPAVSADAKQEARAAWGLFAQLQAAQPNSYALWLDTQAEQVLSVSPELFFDWDGQHILSRPMKGTAARGATPELDAQAAQTLAASAKERAENVMIVDLIRNDLSRIAQPHTVQVPALCAVQALPTVWQMTSDVVAQTRPGITLGDVFAALFPCGSITGAPKVRAMQHIATLEDEPRGIYCGAVGIVRPGGHATFNVGIRTVVAKSSTAAADDAAPRWVSGVGSGITADAQADAEWAEWLAKRAFLERASAPFELLETLALDAGHLRHAALHLQRMRHAAQHFGYPWCEEAAYQALQAVAQQHPQGLWRVRLLLGRSGQYSAQAFAMHATPEPVQLQLASQPMEWAHSEFVRFKTTHRAHYDALGPTAAQTQAGVFDTVLYNLRGEITECTRGNVALLLDGHWVTPALQCGLLGGVGRQIALQEGRVQEAVVTLADLPRVQAVAFVNSLRGWLQAQLVR